jgi:hypothetical protein
MVDIDSDSTFSATWLGIAFGVGISLQVVGWLVGLGVFTGLPAYFLVGLLTAWGSPGDTLAEPAVAAFLIATIGYILDHLLLTLVLVGIPLGLLYGLLGLLLALVGAYLGERFLD